MAQLEDNDYFESENLHHLPADHPLMSRLQAALKLSLENDHEKVHLKLRDKEAKLKAVEKERETTAVQLYEVQQNLADMHLNLEQTHQNYNLIQKLRVEAEQKLSVMNQTHLAKKVEVEQLQKNTVKAMDELSRMTRTFKQLEDYNVAIASDTALGRRLAYRAEENITQQEKLKKKQDLLIDHLTEQKKKVNEQITIIEAQLLAQQDETKAARDILKEAFSEMDKIVGSKKDLLNRWQKALLEMQKRDKALQVAREALKVQYETNVQMNSELNGCNNEIRREAATSETLTSNLNRLKLDEKYLDDQKEKLDHDYQKLSANIKILQQSLQSTEANAQTSERENKKITDQMTVIEDNIMKIHTQASKLYDQVIHKLSEHKTLEKKSAIMLKQSQICGQEIEEKEIERETVENEIARVNIDILNTTNQLEALKSKKREVSEERKKKEETVATYDLEIRQGHDINEKKQAEVGKLNKVHDEIINSSTESSRGPLDAQISHLNNQLKDMGLQIHNLERDWIKKQTNLVKKQQKFGEITEDSDGLKTKKVILEQKKMRLDTIEKSHLKEVRDIKIGLKNLQTEMNRLNEGKSKNEESELKLVNETFNIQSEFVEKLKELESFNVKLEISIDALKEEKAELLQNIVESEKQLLLWERKIQLEKEMQAALDPDIGQSELKLLKKDIHMMELRLQEIRKKQEEVIMEMEREIQKRDIIQLKYTQPDNDEKRKPGKENKTHVQKQIQTLKGNLKQSSQNNLAFDKKLKELQMRLNDNTNLLKTSEDTSRKIENELSEKLTQLNQSRIEKFANVFEISKMQHTARAYQNIADKAFRFEANENQLRSKYEQQRELNTQVILCLREIADSNPQYHRIFQSLVDIKVE